ncbi:hypothetical protein L1D13_09165, partial [Vibrio tubiashii]
MKIKKLSYSDSTHGSAVSPIEFERLNVLVGVSGAGKTTILNGISKIAHLAFGERSSGVQWDIEYLDDKDNLVSWSGKQSKSFTVEDSGERISKYTNEYLSINGELVFERTEGKTIFNGNSLPTLDQTLSLMYLLREDEKLKYAYECWLTIVFIDVGNDNFSNASMTSTLSATVED